MQFTDFATLAGARTTREGYLVADVRCARTGCQTYLASELGLTDGGIVTVYRPESAVFDKTSLATFAGKPVTLGHPLEPVTADSWKQHAVGETGDEVARDGETVRVGIMVRDAAAIRAISDGTREISMGYTTPLEMRDGVAPDGTPYQAVQTGPIIINHLALVDRARGGSELRVGDGARATWGASPTFIDRKDVTMADAIKTRTVLIDGLSVETTDAGAQALEKLQKTIGDKDRAIADAAAAHSTALAAKDEEIGTLKAELADAKKNVLDQAAIDKLVADRAALVSVASKLAKDVKPEGLSDAALRKAVVATKLGDEAVKDASDAEVKGMFAVIARDADKSDVVADAMAGTTPNVVTDLNAVYAERNKALSDAWKRPAAKKEA